MAWEVVRVSSRRDYNGTPKARVARGSIHFNGAAINLVGKNVYGGFAELMMDLEDGRIGVHFLEEKTDDAIAVHQSKSKGKPGRGVIITSRAHMRELFGEEGVSGASTKYAVSLDPDERDVLVLTQ